LGQQSLDQDAGRSFEGGSLGRLTKRAEFQRVSRGRRKSVGAFALQAALRANPEAEATQPRIGLTVTKKVGNAVIRNRIRRRLKEALRAAGPLEARGDHDYVLVARHEAILRPFSALVSDLRDAFRAVAHEEASRRQPGRTAAKDRDTRP
jgi:ribonuclease P protein component